MPNITGVDTSSAVFYAMDPEALKKYADFKDKISAESINLSSDEIKRIKAELQEARADGRELFTVAEEGTADIIVAGPLEPKPDACAIMFGAEMTTYEDIIKGIRAANADNNIEKIRFLFSTPGGNVVGLFAAADEIRNSEKPTVAVVYSTCASAGYALASQCGTIEAENISAEVGSIGVVMELIDRSGANGTTRYVLTSENAENKRPDVTTEEGRSKIVARLTEYESVFIEYVASGRNTTMQDVKDNFGRGGMLIARKAREIGMIDSIQSEINAGTPPAAGNTDPGNTTRSENETEGAEGMEMTQEQIEKIAAAAATQAAAKASDETALKMKAEMEAKDAAQKAEADRVAGFAKLKEKYPKMSGMIDDEMKKEGSVADLDFAMKVSDAEIARAAAEKEQTDAAGDQAETGAADGKPQGEQDQSGNILAAAFGLPVGGK